MPPDNIVLPGTGTTVVTEDIGAAVQMPVSKLYTGAHGVNGGAVTAANPLNMVGGAIQSTNNSTAVALAGSATFVGVADNIMDYGDLTIVLSGTPDNAQGTLFFEFGPDGAAWPTSVPIPVNNLTVFIPYPLRHVDKFFRVRYVNGTVAQTTFGLRTFFYKTAPGVLVRTAGQTVQIADPVLLTRALIEPSHKGSLSVLGADREMGGNVVDLVYVQQASGQWDVPVANNDATATSSGGGSATQAAATGLTLTTANAAGASAAKVVVNKKIRYRPTCEERITFSVAFSAVGIANSTALIGLSDETGLATNNRFALGYNGATFGFTIENAGAIVHTAKTAWNGDPLDGGPFSGFRSNNAPVAIDVTKSNQWRIRFIPGVGPLQLEVKSPDNIWVVAHTVRQPNTSTTPIIQNPTLFMFAETTKVAAAGVGTVMMTSFEWGGGTIENPEGFEIHEINGNKYAQAALAAVAANTNLWTVSTGRQLYVKSLNISLVNTNGITAGRLDLIDATAGTGTTPLLHSIFVPPALNVNSELAQMITYPDALVVLNGIRLVLVTGTLTVAISMVGYEKEL